MKKRILIVESDDRFRGILVTYLHQEEAFEVLETDTSEDALDKLTNGEHFDVLIVQLMMAKDRNWTFLKTIRTKLHLSETDLPILLVSDVSSDVLETKAFRQGANGFYVKEAATLQAFVRDIRIQTGCVRSRYSDITKH